MCAYIEKSKKTSITNKNSDNTPLIIPKASYVSKKVPIENDGLVVFTPRTSDQDQTNGSKKRGVERSENMVINCYAQKYSKMQKKLFLKFLFHLQCRRTRATIIKMRKLS